MGRKKKNNNALGMNLSQRHKLFADELIMNGGILYQAYMAAYPECTDRVRASQSGWKLANMNEKVKEYIERTRVIMASNYQISRDKIIEEILDQIEACKIESDRTNLIKLLDMLNKMASHYTTKAEVTHKGIVFNFIEPTDVSYIEQNLLEE